MLISLCAAALAAVGVWGFLSVSDLFAVRSIERGREVDVLILPGWTARDVASAFAEAGAVPRSRDFARAMGRLGIDRRIRPGLYRVRAGRAADVAMQMREAAPQVVRALLLPGALFEDVAAALERGDGAAALERALGSAENFPEGLRPLLPETARDRIVFLAPETYELDPGEESANAFVRVASAKWWSRHGERIPPGTTSADLRADAVLASIVQKEAKVDGERPVIAGVFKNRLREDMPLQSCATVVHAWRLRGVRIATVRYEDVKVDSPFNTYIHSGLPPEHIGIPSESSWNAVLAPAKTKMLFFVAKRDGSHVFSKTYREHLAAQKKIRAGEL